MASVPERRLGTYADVKLWTNDFILNQVRFPIEKMHFIGCVTVLLRGVKIVLLQFEYHTPLNFKIVADTMP